MARIDSFLAQLVAYQAEELLLEAGDNLYLCRGGQRVPLVQAKPGTLLNAHVAALLAEVAPTPARAALATGAPTTFDYTLGNCVFRCEVILDEGRVRARIRDVPEEALSVSELDPGVVEGEPVDDEPGLARLVRAAWAMGASDVHLSAGHAPRVRVDGAIRTLPGAGALDPYALQKMIEEHVPSPRLAELEARGDTASSWDCGELRVRTRVFRAAGGLGAVLQLAPRRPPSLDEIGAPPELAQLCALERGLVVVAGPARSGRTTTMAAMVRRLNEHAAKSVLVVERAVERVHEPAGCAIQQRERGTASAAPLLRAAADVDVVVVDLDDGETIEAALDLADAGALVIGAMNAAPPGEVVARLVERVATERRERARRIAEEHLAGAIHQEMRAREGGGRAARFDVRTREAEPPALEPIEARDQAAGRARIAATACA